MCIYRLAFTFPTDSFEDERKKKDEIKEESNGTREKEREDRETKYLNDAYVYVCVYVCVNCLH